MKTTAHDVTKRRLAVIALLQSGSHSADELVALLRPRPAKSTVDKDLAWIRATFPSQITSAPSLGTHGTSRVVFTWHGDGPTLLDDPPTWISETELVALVAACGLLRQGDPKRSSTNPAPGEHDLLARAISSLLERMGAKGMAEPIGRHRVSVSRFGAAPTDPAVLIACLKATTLGQAVRFTYANLANEVKEAHAAPQRMVLIRGEWYCMAWADVLRMYRIARMRTVQLTKEMPPGMPARIPSIEVDAQLQSGFFATNSSDPAKRQTVVLAVHPNAWPFICDRRWGDGQRVDEAPVDLEDGWRRLTFTTTGLSECRHWVLGMGAGVIAEQPSDLVVWIKAEARALLERMAASPVV